MPELFFFLFFLLIGISYERDGNVLSLADLSSSSLRVLLLLSLLEWLSLLLLLLEEVLLLRLILLLLESFPLARLRFFPKVRLKFKHFEVKKTTLLF